jgi:uncharacterized membrane protein
MLDEISKYLAIYAMSMFKFVAGPFMGIGFGLSLFETVTFTCLGMMTSVLVFSNLLGNRIKIFMENTFFKKRTLFSKANRRKVKLWRSYGLIGVAFLTPILFTPIGGTLLAASFGESKKRIFIYMFLSSLFWSVIFSSILTVFKSTLMPGHV